MANLAVFPAAVRAAGVWTVSASHLADAETVTFGGKVYTFKNTVSTTDGNVYLPTGGDDAADVAAVANLIKAINLTGVAGTDYGTNMVKHAMVYAVAGATTRKVKVIAKCPGTAGNYIAFVDGSSAGSVDAAVLGTAVAGVGDGITELLAYIANIENTCQVNAQVQSYIDAIQAALPAA